MLDLKARIKPPLCAGEMFVGSVRRNLRFCRDGQQLPRHRRFWEILLFVLESSRTKLESLKACVIPPAYVYSLVNIHMELVST